MKNNVLQILIDSINNDTENFRCWLACEAAKEYGYIFKNSLDKLNPIAREIVEHYIEEKGW
jgi:hypothetical protein